MASTPPSCRILTVASSPPLAKLIVERIIAAHSTPEETALPVRQAGTSSSSEYLSWTISNKYYTAPVHFFITQIAEVTNDHTFEVPACLYVFDPTTPFKDDFAVLTTLFKDADFEVCIAVSAPSPSRSPTTDEHEAYESFFGEHGFEYVNGDAALDSTQGHDMDDLEGIPGLNRVIDALSTILWPSMVQKSGSRRAKARSVVSVPGPPGDDEESEGLKALLNADKPKGEEGRESTALERERAALEKWLEEDEDVWTGAISTSTATTSTIATASTSGFDDNFTDFIAAPSETNKSGSGDEDTDLPSRAEIDAMSQRIRGMAIPEDDNDFDGAFDLSRVLSGLEAMKSEISGINDEDERRKAAAKVALGLVYGLGGEDSE